MSRPPRTPYPSPEVVAEIRQRYTNGVRQKDLAAEYKLSLVQLRKALACLPRGIPRGPTPRLSPEQVTEMWERYGKGATQSQLAVEYGVTPGRISQLLKGSGFRRRGRGLPRMLTPEQVDHLRAQVCLGRSAFSMARELDISAGMAYQIIRRKAYADVPDGPEYLKAKEFVEHLKNIRERLNAPDYTGP